MKTDRELLQQVVEYLPECSLTAQEIRARLAEPEHTGEEQLSALVQELDAKLAEYERALGIEQQEKKMKIELELDDAALNDIVIQDLQLQYNSLRYDARPPFVSFDREEEFEYVTELRMALKRVLEYYGG